VGKIVKKSHYQKFKKLKMVRVCKHSGIQKSPKITPKQFNLNFYKNKQWQVINLD
jgi:hypothetical protein